MGAFEVKRLSKMVVAAALPPQEHWLLQSNIDLLMPVKVDMNTFFCYRKPLGDGHTFSSIVNVLKEVTQLRCGGVVIGCTFDHRASDAYSANMFWKSWAEMAQSKPLSSLPSFRRSILSARHSGRFDPSITDFYVPVSKLQPSETLPHTIISHIYSIPAEQIQNLQLLANRENPSSLIRKRTKLEAFTVFLWNLIATGTNVGDGFCRMGIILDGRTRIGVNGEMCNYFGNVLAHTFGKKTNNELVEMPLSSIANEVNKFIEEVTSRDNFLGLIDYVEANKPKPVVLKMLEGGISMEDPALTISYGRGFSIAKMDFRWGVPVFGSNLCPPGMSHSFVMPMLEPSGENGDWIVYVCLPEDQIQWIENIAANIMKPFTLG